MRKEKKMNDYAIGFGIGIAVGIAVFLLFII